MNVTEELPLVTIDAPLTIAIAAMRERKRSSIVAKDADKYWLFKAGQIVVGNTRGLKTLGDIEKRWPVNQPSIDANITRRGVDFQKPSAELKAHEANLDQLGRLYALSSASGKSVRGPTIEIVVTYVDFEKRWFETSRAMDSGPADCYCTNPNLDEPHAYKPPPIPAGGRCECGYAIVCA